MLLLLLKCGPSSGWKLFATVRTYPAHSHTADLSRYFSEDSDVIFMHKHNGFNSFFCSVASVFINIVTSLCANFGFNITIITDSETVFTGFNTNIYCVADVIKLTATRFLQILYAQLAASLNISFGG